MNTKWPMPITELVNGIATPSEVGTLPAVGRLLKEARTHPDWGGALQSIEDSRRVNAVPRTVQDD